MLEAAVMEFGADKAGRMAAALTYYTIFAMVPLLFLAVGIAGVVLSGEDVVGDIVEQAEEIAGEVIADELETVLDFVTANSGSFIGIGAIAAAFAASGIFLQVQGVLNAIFHVPEEKTSGILAMVAQRTIALVSALVIAVLAFLPLVAVGAVNLIRNLLNEIPGMPPEVGNLIANVGVPLISVGMMMLAVTVTFQALAQVSIPWRAARRGGMLTTVLILAGAFGVGLFFQYGLLSGSSGRSALGAFGGVAVLLLFFYLMWQIYLFGAEVTKVYADYLAHGDFMKPSQREETSRKAHLLTTERPLFTSPSLPSDTARTGLIALLVGFVVGWWVNRD